MEKTQQKAAFFRDIFQESFAFLVGKNERCAIGALFSCRVHFVGYDLDLVQRAVVLTGTVVGALHNGTFDAFVNSFLALFLHNNLLLIENCAYFNSKNSLSETV